MQDKNNAGRRSSASNQAIAVLLRIIVAALALLIFKRWMQSRDSGKNHECAASCCGERADGDSDQHCRC